MKISPSRTAAFDVLLRIAEDRAFSSVLLPIYEEKLSRADAALCHEIVLGVLRRQVYLDRVIDTLAKNKKLDHAVRISLQIGLYQLIALNKIPTHSAVNESVNLVSRAKKTSAKGFVNALLRRFVREPFEIEFKGSDNIDRLATTTSHPRWLVEKWTRDFGFEAATKIAESNNRIPTTAFRLLANNEETLELVQKSRPSEHVKGCWIANEPASTVKRLVESGLIYIQDEGSQIVASSIDLPLNSRFLDVCAAPGGKTGLIARSFPHSKLIAAGDLHGKRTELLRKNCEMQASGKVGVLQYDALRSLPFSERSFDCVLVDAPCSGTGTIRHNPELRYFLDADDFSALQKKQLAILENASKLVVLGGELIYSTCSLEREENEQVAAIFLERNRDFSLEKPRVDGSMLTADDFARTWPWRDAMDGFFIAAFRRTK